MDLVFEKLTQTLGAGQSWPSQIAGNFFRLAVAAYPVSVSLIKDFRIIGTMQNMLAGDYVKDIEFDGVVILNGATGQDVTIQIAGGGAGSDRVLGEVSVINGELARVKANACFLGVLGVTGAAGAYTHAQLHNPAGSGKNVLFSRATLFAPVAEPVYLQRYDTFLTDSAGVRNKNLGGAIGGAKLGFTTNAAMLGTTMGFASVSAPNQITPFDCQEPILIPPGAGVLFVGLVVNTSLYATFQWTEESI